MTHLRSTTLFVGIVPLIALACGGDDGSLFESAGQGGEAGAAGSGEGGATAHGGTGAGGSSNGGASGAGGTSSGGASGAGGTSSGGASGAGGTSNGGASGAGGTSNGGASGAGGTSNGGASGVGGTSNGGSGGGCQSGFHDCSGVCKSDTSPDSCGAACAPCPKPGNGFATCESGVCGVGCNDGWVLCNGICTQEGPGACGQDCTVCPSSPDAVATCEAHACKLTCKPGTNPCPTGCCGWGAETIGGGSPADVALRIGPSGQVHVAYMVISTSSSSSSYSAVHALRATPGWQLSWVASESHISSSNPRNELQGIGLAIDANGTPFVGYARTERWNTMLIKSWVRVASQGAGGTWSSESVDYAQSYSGGVSSPITLQFDGAGKLHTTFLECCQNNYYSFSQYGVRAGGAWSVEDMPITDSVSLAVESGGTPHALVGDNGLAVSTKSGGAWQTSSITGDSSGPWASSKAGSIALDSQGRQHVCYQSGTNGKQLVHALRSGNQWATEVVDATAGSGEFCAIAVDSADRPLICYRSPAHGFKCAAVVGGAWTTAVIAAGDYGQGVDVAFDAQNRAHVVYYDNVKREWKYMH